MSAKLWRGLAHNWSWKLGALAVAILVWLILAGAPEAVALQSVPILYQNLHNGLILAADAPGSLRAELRGPARNLTESALSSVFVRLDLSSVDRPGEQTLTISSAEFNLPHGVAFLRAIPSQVRLQIFRIASKEVPVRVRLDGALPPGYRIVQAQPLPDRVRISGPEPRVQSIVTANTDFIDVRNLTQTTEVQTNAFVDDARVQFESAPVVKVRLIVEKIQDGRE
ncbi:MAG TPA: CdaR family protein [Bryobacteraceae bacterium]|nr:CdaR family protein [Bryobacteraceae bacterium]